MSQQKQNPPLYRREGQYIYFGRWPQSKKEDSVTVTQGVSKAAPVENAAWYFTGSDGEIYFKGSRWYGSLETVFYKVEPIKWRILEEKDGEALLLSDKIIDVEYFGGSNCYSGSNLDEWMNRHIYGTAFTDEERELILLSHIDNSVESTGLKENPDVVGDDEEYIFLLSYKEAFQSYGLTNEDRAKTSTDFAISRGGDSYIGDWVLRSPFPDVWHYEVFAVDSDGKEGVVNISEWYYGGSSGDDGACTGVVPAIRIRLKD